MQASGFNNALILIRRSSAAARPRKEGSHFAESPQTTGTTQPQTATNNNLLPAAAGTTGVAPYNALFDSTARLATINANQTRLPETKSKAYPGNPCRFQPNFW